MVPADPGSAKVLVEAIIAAFSILGGGMALFSGFNAAESLAQDRPPAVVAHSVNKGIGKGFETSASISIATLVIMAWT